MKTLRAVLLCGGLLLIATTVSAQDLSKYRDFSLGMTRAQLATRTGQSATELTTLLARPALIQETSWRPRQPLMAAPQIEPVQRVDFTLLNGQLYRIVVHYNREQTEGMTIDDLRQALSAQFGEAVEAQGRKDTDAPNDLDTPVARWENAEFRNDLYRSAWSDYRLEMVVLASVTQADVATALGSAMTLAEAPMLEAARLREEANELARARQRNKKLFRP